MKQYVIDQLRPGDQRKLCRYLDEHFEKAGIEGVYRIRISSNLLNNVQRLHRGCQPHYVTAVADADTVAFEFLVRSSSRVRCDCMGYADTKQRLWIIALVDDILKMLEIEV